MAEEELKELLFSFLRNPRRHEEEEEEGPSSRMSRESYIRNYFSAPREADEHRRRSRHENMNRHQMEREIIRRFQRDPRDFYRRGFMDEEDESPERYSEVSSFTKPEFRLREGVQYLDIMKLFEKPYAYQRRKGVVILLRGPRGCGQANLASMLSQKEQSVGNSNIKLITLKELLSEREPVRDRRERDRDLLTRPNEKLYYKFREIIRNERHAFIVAETGTSSSDVNSYLTVASHQNSYFSYVIEMMQSEETVMRYARDSKNDYEAKQDLENMKTPLDKNVILLDPIKLYEKDMKVERINTIIDRYLYRHDYSTSAHIPETERQYKILNPLRNLEIPESEDREVLKESLKDQKLVEVLQSKYLNLIIDPKSLRIKKSKEKNSELEDILSITREHKFQQTSDQNGLIESEQFEELKGFLAGKIFDYNHLNTEKLINFESVVKMEHEIE